MRLRAPANARASSARLAAWLGPLVAIVLCTPPAQAQERPDSARGTAVYLLPGVRVTALRPVATGDGGSALDVRLDSLRLSAAPTFDRVLRDLPFIQVRTNPRGEAYFALRGSGFNAREVAVLVDGVPVSLNFDHRADLSLLPATGAQTLTVVRGLPSLLYGPNVLGGVVDIGIARVPSPRAGGDVRARLESGVDHTGAYGLASGVTVPVRVGAGDLLVSAGAGYRRSSGFPLPAGVREPDPFGDRSLRLNSFSREGDAYLAVRWQTAHGAWASVSSSGYSVRRGVPAQLDAKSPQLLQYPVGRRLFSVVSLGTGQRRSVFGGRGRVELNVGVDAGRTEVKSFTSRAYATVRGQEADDDRGVTARLVGDQTLGGGGDLHAAFTFGEVRRHEALTPGATSDYRQRLWSGATEAGWRLPRWGGLSSLRASAGVALDAADTPESGGAPPVGELRAWGGRAGLVGSADGGRVLVHAGVSRRVRFPSLRELYSGTLANVAPNPDLRPEAMVTAEAGATFAVRQAQIQAVGFHTRIRDEIVSSVTPQKKVQRVNRDRTTATGVELLGSVPIGPAGLSLDLTAQTVDGLDPTSGESFRSEYQPRFAGGVRLVAPVPAGASLAASLRAVGTQYCVDAASADGYHRLDATTRAGVELSRAWIRSREGSGWLRSMEVSVAVDNVRNQAVFDQCGLPQPGRVLRAQVRLR